MSQNVACMGKSGEFRDVMGRCVRPIMGHVDKIGTRHFYFLSEYSQPPFPSGIEDF